MGYGLRALPDRRVLRGEETFENVDLPRSTLFSKQDREYAAEW